MEIALVPTSSRNSDWETDFSRNANISDLEVNNMEMPESQANVHPSLQPKSAVIKLKCNAFNFNLNLI